MEIRDGDPQGCGLFLWESIWVQLPHEILLEAAACCVKVSLALVLGRALALGGWVSRSPPAFLLSLGFILQTGASCKHPEPERVCRAELRGRW